MTATFNSEDSYFAVNDGVALRDISPYITRVDGLPSAKELRDITALGDAGHKWGKGIWRDTTISIELWWSDDASVGPDTVVRLLNDLTAATAFSYGPEGSDSGDQKVSGTCWLEDFVIHTTVGTRLAATLLLKVEGEPSFGTFAGG